VNAVEVAAVIVGIFFTIGITVGVIGVIAISALHARRLERGEVKSHQPGELPDLGTQGFRYNEHEELDDNDDRPRWPGGL
jgi:hypothetical protein